MNKTIAMIMSVGMMAGYARADLFISALNTPTVFDFEGFTAGGFSPTPTAGQLDSDNIYVTGFSDAWADQGYGGTSPTSGDYARGSGSDAASSAGIYNFANAPSDALGVMSSASEFTPGSIRLRLQNLTGSAINSWNISYDIYYLVTGTGTRTQSVSFAVSSDDFSTVNQSVASLSSLALPTATWTSESFSTSGVGLTVANNDYFYLEITGDDAGGSGSRSKFAIDNLSITAVPEPATMSMLLLGLVGARGMIHRRKRS